MGDKNQSRLNLHETLRGKTYGNALISTYTFSPNFFEEYCLQKFNSLYSNPNITVLIDRSEYEQAITAPEQYRTKLANLRYLLHPISVPGVFHPKVFLFTRKNSGKLIVGSANFSRSGITQNAELVGVFDYEESNPQYLKLFQDALKFFIEIQSRYPSDTLSSNIQTMLRETPWLSLPERDTKETEDSLVDNFEMPILEQLASMVKSKIDCLWVLSRYFDSAPDLLDRVVEMLQPKKIRIFTQNGTTTLNDSWIEHRLVKTGHTEIYLAEYKDADQYQPLHAKALLLDAGREDSLLCYGSANFTTPALAKTPKNGNLEAVVILKKPGLGKKQINLLFDPSGTSVRLKNIEKLVSAQPEPFDPGKRHPIHLNEVERIENKIRLSADIDPEFMKQQLMLRLDFEKGATQAFQLLHDDGSSYHADVSSNIIQRLEQSSTVAQVVVFDKRDEELASSNKMLIINLMDVNTGRAVRKERYVKEAQENISQFFQVLNDLNAGGDEDALLAFLNYCDIPVINAERPRLFRGDRPGWDGGQGMRKIGKRNLKVFLSLHEATVSFFDRHYRKLKKHVESGSLSGVGNFMHIWLAMGGILRNQVERAMQGFETSNSPMTLGEWYDYRQHLDTYFVRFEELMDCLWFEYVSPLLKTYKLPDIKKKFEPEMNPLEELCDDMLNFRARLEKVRRTSLKVMTPNAQVLTPAYFNNIFTEQRWKKYSKKICQISSDMHSSMI
jgi:phosphatidylserine/phosphatidylglycerophosphate/cardiolipin synthase-like enzyme